MGQFIDFAYVKTNANFPSVLQHYEISAKGGGDEIRCQCPFHDDETPSMSVNVDKKVFTCHADSCGESGNILEFVNEMEGEPGLREAARTLADICQIELAAPKRKPREGNGRAKKDGKQSAKRKPKSATREAAAAARNGEEPLFEETEGDQPARR